MPKWVIYTERIREEIIAYIKTMRLKSRVEVKNPARSNDQNSRMWAMIGDIVRQRKTVRGQEYNDKQWKVMFMWMLGHELEILPHLHDDGWGAADTSTSILSERQMSDLIDCITAWGNENNVVWSDPALRAQEEMMR